GRRPARAPAEEGRDEAAADQGAGRSARQPGCGDAEAVRPAQRTQVVGYARAFREHAASRARRRGPWGSASAFWAAGPALRLAQCVSGARGGLWPTGGVAPVSILHWPSKNTPRSMTIEAVVSVPRTLAGAFSSMLLVALASPL